ncbi:MAG: hypothetical protein ACRCYX_05675 [Dermatophilaceae bacterium]
MSSVRIQPFTPDDSTAQCGNDLAAADVTVTMLPVSNRTSGSARARVIRDSASPLFATDGG